MYGPQINYNYNYNSLHKATDWDTKYCRGLILKVQLTSLKITSTHIYDKGHTEGQYEGMGSK